MTVRVLVVDDHPVFREGLAASLAAIPGIEVVGRAADGPEAVEAAATGTADVVLMDLNLPSMSGVEATALTCALPDPPAVLVVTMVDDDDTVLAAMRAGARGYVLKGSTGEEIAAAVTTVASGGAVFGPGVASRLLAAAATGDRPGPGRPSSFAGLTEREADVLELLGEGRSNQQIARDLGLSVKTVQNYVSRILDKLQVRDRTQAALRVRGEHVGGGQVG
ncbi:MAG TPA: response regulator transcription factor [Nocardioides sp.]|uniref:response regulator transcription factor n=1 Tax=Nocardioides sp. TaxID=35761 RepID=UPI002F4285B1